MQKSDDASAQVESPGQDVETKQVSGETIFLYHYYPDNEVYFDTIRHLYFYRDNGIWTMSVALPGSFQENLGSSVWLKLKSAKPYLSHSEQIQKYPPGSGGRGF